MGFMLFRRALCPGVQGENFSYKMQITFRTILLEATLMCHGSTRDKITSFVDVKLMRGDGFLWTSFSIPERILTFIENEFNWRHWSSPESDWKTCWRGGKKFACVKNNVKLRVKRFGRTLWRLRSMPENFRSSTKTFQFLSITMESHTINRARCCKRN